MKLYKLYWKDNETEIVSGKNIADAMTLAGYGQGALGALDSYEAVTKTGKRKKGTVLVKLGSLTK